MATPTKIWVESIQAHLDLLLEIVRKIPADELLEAKDLNKILESHEEFKTLFLIHMAIQGFKIQR